MIWYYYIPVAVIEMNNIAFFVDSAQKIAIWVHRTISIDVISYIISTWTIPPMIRELSSESNLIEVEIIEHTIEKSAWSSIESWISRDLLYLIEDDGLLWFEWFFLSQEGIVIVAIAVNIIGINLLEILREFDFEESASCGIGIELASIVPIWFNFGVNKGSIEEIVDLTIL